jgi:5'-3' exonuclease
MRQKFGIVEKKTTRTGIKYCTCGNYDKDDDAENHADNAADPNHIVTIIVRDLNVRLAYSKRKPTSK